MNELMKEIMESTDRLRDLLRDSEIESRRLHEGLLKMMMKQPLADPNCKHCEGTGIQMFSNGPDDYTKEECVCVK